MYCPECGTELNSRVSYCTECGVEQPGGDGVSVGEDGQATGEVSISVEAAAAVDIACRHCGERPIEEIAKGHRITGMILFYRWGHQNLIGCHQCLRNKLWKMAGKNLLTGWWGIRSAALTPFLVLWNFGRGSYNRGPNQNLVRALRDAGILFDFLHDKSRFESEQHHRMELYIRGMLRLGVAVMLADGEVHETEREALVGSVKIFFPSYPEEKTRELIDRSAKMETDVAAVAEGLGEMLATDGKRLFLKFAADIVESGKTSEEGIEITSIIARSMELDETDVAKVLSTDEQAVKET